jgi:hypothetical protein
VRDLKPHTSYAQIGIKIPASKMNELVELGEDAFIFPLFVTSTGIVIDGYARLEVARLQGRETVTCVEFDIPEEEAYRPFAGSSLRYLWRNLSKKRRFSISRMVARTRVRQN